VSNNSCENASIDEFSITLTSMLSAVTSYEMIRIRVALMINLFQAKNARNNHFLTHHAHGPVLEDLICPPFFESCQTRWIRTLRTLSRWANSFS